VQVEIWSDVVCPWCYIGKRRFEAALARFEHAGEVELRWRSFELDPKAPPRRTRAYPEAMAHKYGVPVEQARARIGQLDALAAAEGLPFDLARTQGGNTFDGHRLIHLAEHLRPGAGAAMKEALLRAYFVDLLPVGERGTLLRVAESEGLGTDVVAATLDSDRFVAEVRADEDEAAALGCTGVPFFVIDRAWAVPGAQDSDTFLAVLRRAWTRSHPDAVSDQATGTGTGACSGDECAV